MSPKRKIYASLTVFGLLFFLFAVLIIYPLIGGIKKDSEELLSQKNSLASFLEEIKNLQNSKELYLKNQSDLEKINKLFVSSEIPIDFIVFLEKTAADSQLSIDVSSLAATEKKETEGWPSLSFLVTVKGSSAKFLKFLERLENNHYLIEVVNLDLKRATGGEGALPGSTNASFTIKVFTR